MVAAHPPDLCDKTVAIFIVICVVFVTIEAGNETAVGSTVQAKCPSGVKRLTDAVWTRSIKQDDPGIKLFENGSAVQGIPSSYNVTIDATSGVVLTITDLKPSDAGNYTCSLKGKPTPAVSKEIVVIAPPVSVDWKNSAGSALSNGSDVMYDLRQKAATPTILTCEAKSYTEMASIQVTLGNRMMKLTSGVKSDVTPCTKLQGCADAAVMSTNIDLKPSTVSSADNGRLLVCAANQLDHKAPYRPEQQKTAVLKLNVEFNPERFTIDPATPRVKIGTKNFNLTASFYANPLPANCKLGWWFGKIKAPIPNTKQTEYKLTEETVGDKRLSILTIKDFKLKNAGFYFVKPCRAVGQEIWVDVKASGSFVKFTSALIIAGVVSSVFVTTHI
ncbi:uncharacterized protein LOC141912040 [Tubulanus polymorphus]|uniref:uncharacterized protein LOC141912040 n=1 Tax=Tubulanus polymorphus TaxID=672921 RepID=UPI003DA4DF60